MSWPVVEIFGPTIQGEGVDQGVSCDFVRFGGCDFKCDWCDTPHAVVPSEVREAARLNARDILSRLSGLDSYARWTILSGGNPALHDLSELVDQLHVNKQLVAVETQGTRWQPWLADVDRLCVSPKPPSSGMSNTLALLAPFMKLAQSTAHARFIDDWLFLKVVIFNDADLEYARDVRRLYPDVPLYLSAGNDAGRTVGNPTRVDRRSENEVRLDLLNKSEALVAAVMKCPVLSNEGVRVQSQYHVLLWGNKQGV